jgi:hypothetical protein
LDERSACLFKAELESTLEPLRPKTSAIMDRALLDNICALSAADVAGVDLLLRAVEATVRERAMRGARQIEEHYLRRVEASPATDLRHRLERAIAGIDAGAIAANVLDPPRRARGGAPKRRGLDDGVQLP